MSKTQQIGDRFVQLNIGSSAPTTSDIGIVTASLPGGTHPSTWIITAVVTSAPSDLTIYACDAVGAASDETDDRWGLFNDKRGVIKAGKMATALAIGTHHFIVEDVGIFSRLFFVKSAGAIDVYASPIHFGARGN